MPEENTTITGAFSTRFHSIDVFRAITMFLMIFVNDVSGVSHIPSWIEHAAYNEDRMGFADTIFPTFLFIVGLSLPPALMKRTQKGDPFIKTLSHILSRSFALIVMGFFHVNLESYSSEAPIPRPVWGLLITLSFFLIWLRYPASVSNSVKLILRALGAATLLAMAYLYAGGDKGSTHGMEPSWWGILGIIGWAYLVSAVVFVITGGNKLFLGGATLVFLLINVLSHTNLIPFEIPVIGDASSISLIMTGALTSVLYVSFAARRKRSIWVLFTLSAILLFSASAVIRPYSGGISKIAATPAWVMISAAIAILFFELLIWLVDIKRKQQWFSPISAGGTSTLTCYLMPYLLYFTLELAGVWYPSPFNSGITGILRSMIISLALIMLVKQMEKKSIRLKI